MCTRALVHQYARMHCSQLLPLPLCGKSTHHLKLCCDREFWEGRQGPGQRGCGTGSMEACGLWLLSMGPHVPVLGGERGHKWYQQGAAIRRQHILPPHSSFATNTSAASVKLWDMGETCSHLINPLLVTRTPCLGYWKKEL